MSRIVFLLEDYSMKVLLDGLLPRLFPELSFLCVPHEGKQDLEKSLPRKLRAWREPGVRFVVVRDNDGADCRDLKSRLVALCASGGREDALVRIACQEVEAWYLGDPEALAAVYGEPTLRALEAPTGAAWAVRAEHPTLGAYHLYGKQSAEPLYTENEHNAQRLWGLTNATPYVKDSFHRRVVNGERDAVNPGLEKVIRKK